MKSLKSIYHFFLSWFGALLYGHPSKKLFVIGVTGTKGKSTTVELINAVLESSGKRTAFISSVQVKIGGEHFPNLTDNTMPGRFFIQRFLRKALGRGAEYAVIEVTSQGVEQYRHRFIDFDAAVFLNLRPEHIEAHGSFDIYRAAKVRFFRDVARCSRKGKKFFFMNQGDVASGYFREAADGYGELRYFSRDSFIETRLARGKVSIGDWLSNDFNLENAAAATAVAEALSIPWDRVKAALTSFKGVAGRMDVVVRNPFQVIIDYAHTPDSLEAVYKFLAGQRAKAGGRKLVCVFGSAGGGRDAWKRPEMGRIAARYCREVVLTDEDSYDDDPAQIIGEIKAGALSEKFSEEKIYEIPDRKEAIKKALELARRGDTVILTGKGTERWMPGRGGDRIPWDERAVTEELLASIGRSGL